MRRVLYVVLLVVGALPGPAWGQNLLRPHVALVNPLEFGTTCTTATLAAAIAAAPSGQGILMLTPVDRAGTACTWTITSNLTVPITLVLAIPNGARVNVSAGVTLTLVRYPRQDNSDWRTGAGTITILEVAPGGISITSGLLADRPTTCIPRQYYDAEDGPAGCQLSRCNEQGDEWESVGNCGTAQIITGISSDAEGITGLRYSSLIVNTDTDLGQSRSICAQTGTAGITLTLPPATDAPVSEYLIVICDDTVGVLTLEPSGADLINNVNLPFTMAGQGSQMDVTLIGGKWQLVSTGPLTGGTQGIVQLTPRLAGFPTTNPAVLDTSESFPRLLFDNVTAQCAWWTFIMPLDYVSTLAFQYVYSMNTVTTGSHFLDVSVLAITDGTENVVSGSYDTANTCNAAAVPGTANHTQTVSCSLAHTDTLAPGKLTRLRICRNISDTAAEPSELYGGLLTYAR